jgi:hypothetical protein
MQVTAIVAGLVALGAVTTKGINPVLLDQVITAAESHVVEPNVQAHLSAFSW